MIGIFGFDYGVAKSRMEDIKKIEDREKREDRLRRLKNGLKKNKHEIRIEAEDRIFEINDLVGEIERELSDSDADSSTEPENGRRVRTQ